MKSPVLQSLRNQLVVLIAKGISSLPLHVIHSLAQLLGYLTYVSNTRSKRVTKINLSICFPDKDARSINALTRQSLIEDAKTLLESLWLWKNARYAMNNLVGTVENEEVLTAAANCQQRTLIVTPHFGSWEFGGLYSAHRSGLMIMYTPVKIPYINELSRKGRAQTGAILEELNAGSFKKLIHHLKRGGNAAILPDQVPADNAGVYAPFFGRKTFTSTIISKLANKHNCKVIFGYAMRSRYQTLKYDLHYCPFPEDIYSEDPVIAARTLNNMIEKFVRKYPTQYLWSYKRFKHPPAGFSSPY